MNFVSFLNGSIFGKKTIAPITPNNPYAIAVASARGSPIMIAAKKVSENVPKSAPRMNGIAFLRLISLATANGTKSEIVILDEKTIAVRIAPIR